MTYATVTDVTKRLGRAVSSNEERVQVTAWIDDSERIILRRIPDLDARVADGRIARKDVVLVESQCVVRKIKNPDGKQNERIDDYSYGLGDVAASAELTITDDEWDLLLGTAGSIDGAFTITPGRPRASIAPALTVDGWH